MLFLVEEMNDDMTSINVNDERNYYSSDSVCQLDTVTNIFTNLHTSEFLNSIKCLSLMLYELKLKIGILVMLLRDINYSIELCNDTRLILIRLERRILKVKFIEGTIVE